MHTGRNVCIAYGDARRYGFEKLYVPVQFFNSSLLCKLARPAAFPHPCRGYTEKTPRRRSLAIRRFHALFPYIRVRAKSFDTNVFLLCQYAFCTGRKRHRANNSAGIVWNLYEAYRFQLEFALRQTSRAGHQIFSHHMHKGVPSLCIFLFLSQKEVGKQNTKTQVNRLRSIALLRV